jgi:hypothetical protein
MFSLGHCLRRRVGYRHVGVLEAPAIPPVGILFTAGELFSGMVPTAMPCGVVPRSNEISTTSQQAVDTFSQGVKMRGKSAFDATQLPQSERNPPRDCATRHGRLQFEAFMSRSGMRPKMEPKSQNATGNNHKPARRHLTR